jgi:hypothetical protein
MTKRMNFLFTTWEGGGHVTPALEAVRELLARSHRVRVMSEECNRRESETAGGTNVDSRISIHARRPSIRRAIALRQR